MQRYLQARKREEEWEKRGTKGLRAAAGAVALEYLDSRSVGVK